MLRSFLIDPLSSWVQLSTNDWQWGRGEAVVGMKGEKGRPTFGQTAGCWKVRSHCSSVVFVNQLGLSLADGGSLISTVPIICICWIRQIQAWHPYIRLCFGITRLSRNCLTGSICSTSRLPNLPVEICQIDGMEYHQKLIHLKFRSCKACKLLFTWPRN